MKVLYAIQGTGNGHLNRAREIIPILKNHVDELDLLVSGAQHQVDYEHEIKYRYKGLAFHASKTGKVSYFGSFLKVNFARFYNEARNFPAEDYDLIITDFEPVSAWGAKLKNVPCIEMSHQAGVVMSKPRWTGLSDLFIITLMERMCPSNQKLGFNFAPTGQFVHTPVIRKSIRQLNTENRGHYTVYLPGYSNAYLVNELSKYDVHWQVFTKELRMEFKADKIEFKKIDQKAFLESLRTCEGVLCGAGFELPAEALFLSKKVLAIPLKGQFEQQYNALELEKLGATCVPELSWKYHNTINHWTKSSKRIEVNFPDQTEEIVINLLADYRPLMQTNAGYCPQHVLATQ